MHFMVSSRIKAHNLGRQNLLFNQEFIDTRHSIDSNLLFKDIPMILKPKKSLLLFSLSAAFCIQMMTATIAPTSAQMTDEEIYSTMEGDNLPPGYFSPDPIFWLENFLSPNPYVAAIRVLMYPNTAGSWLETNPNDPADANGDAMKDSSYPYLPDTWQDTNNDGMPDQSYDPSYRF